MKNTQLINKIDELLDTYCDGCFVRKQLRKESGKTIAYRFCLEQCTVGENIKQIGSQLKCSK
ncbi:zinc-finger domain-containing protein [Psychrobacillus antarcticus]|uniref:zinc-finger domain-containing protein n=1 Tax=Psychrobacillus antarcticus TaxID=2879115 RepID=UPI002407BB4C|nr:zinc-finger domain-containing protein [Psychrobacillus antarcticus]